MFDEFLLLKTCHSLSFSSCLLSFKVAVKFQTFVERLVTDCGFFFFLLCMSIYLCFVSIIRLEMVTVVLRNVIVRNFFFGVILVTMFKIVFKIWLGLWIVLDECVARHTRCYFEFEEHRSGICSYFPSVVSPFFRGNSVKMFIEFLGKCFINLTLENECF